MDPMPIRSVVEAVGGRWRGADPPPGEPVLGVSIDTRTLAPGSLFVALPGRNFDGRAFVTEALRRGARAALVGAGAVPASGPGTPVIEVDDALAALERLARWWRGEIEAEVIAVTGTVGKTTTKDFLGVILATRFPTVRAPKSFNNRLGVALTLLEARRSDRFVVCETGTSAPGELAALSRLVRPSRVVVTEIGHAHLSGLCDLDGVVREKAGVFEGLIPGGSAFIQARVHGIETLAAAARMRGGRVATFGWGEGDYRIVECRRLRRGDVELPAGEIPCGFRFRLREPGGFEEELILPVPGRHNVANALGAIAVAREAGVDWAALRAGARELTLPPRRFALERRGGVTVIDDTYNASRRSVLAALEEAGEIPLDRPSGRRYLVLGDLLELGAMSEEIHGEIGGRAVASGRFDGLIAVGRESRRAADAAAEAAARSGAAGFRVERLERVEEVAPLLDGLLGPCDLVLFKASRAVGLERAVEETQKRLASRPRAPEPQAAEPAGGAPAPDPGAGGTEGGRAACSTISTL